MIEDAQQHQEWDNHRVHYRCEHIEVQHSAEEIDDNEREKHAENLGGLRI